MTTPIGIARAQVYIVPNFTQFGPQLRAGLAGQLAGIQGQLNAFQRNASSQLNAAAGQSQGIVSRVGSNIKSTLGSAFGAIASLTERGATAAGAALVGIGGFGLKAAASLENTTVAFTSLLGSASAANAMIKDLQNFAATTPFEFQDVAQYAQQFLAMHDSIGLAASQLKPFLQTVGDLGAVTGASTENIHNAILAIGQIGSRGKVTLDNLNQIAQAFPGFNAAAAIAANTGQTTAQVMDQISKGELSAAQGVPALLKGMQQFQGAAGAMAKQSQTLNGLLSTFSDTVKINLTNALTSSIPIVKNALTVMTNSISGALQSVGPAIATVIASITPLLAPLITGIGQALTSVAQGIAPVFAALAPAIAPVAGIFSSIIAAASPLLVLLARLAGQILPPLLSIVQAIAPIFVQLAQSFSNALAPVMPVIISALGQVATAIRNVMPALTPLMNAIAGTFAQALGALVPLFANIITALAPVVSAIATGLTPIIQALGPLFADFARALAPVAAALAEALAPAIKVLADGLAQLVPQLQPVIAAFGDALLSAVRALAPDLPKLAKAFVDILNAILPVLPNLLELAARIAEMAAGPLGFLIDALDKLAPLIPAIMGLFVAKWLLLGSTATTQAGRVGGAFSSMIGPARVFAVLVGAFITQATRGWGDHAKKVEENRQRVAGLTQAIQADSGALGENTRAQIANDLEKSGALKLASQFGISLSQLTDGLTGNKAAAQAAGDQLHLLALKHPELSGDIAILLGRLQDEGVSLKQAEDGQHRVADATHNSATAADIQKQALDTLSSSLQNFNGVVLSNIQTEDSFHKQLNGIAQQVKNNNTPTLIGFSDAAISNREQILNTTRSILDNAEKLRGQGATVQTVTGYINSHRAMLYEAAKAAGVDTTQVHNLTDGLFDIPADVTSTVHANTATAMSLIGQVNQSLRDLTVKPWQVDIIANGDVQFHNAFGGTAKAEGGVLPGWSPGKDNLTFYNPKVGFLHLSGGEGILRPEAVKAIGGAAGLKELNRGAKAGHFKPGELRNFQGGGIIEIDMNYVIPDSVKQLVKAGPPVVIGGGGAGGPATVGGDLGSWIAQALAVTGTPGSWGGAIYRRIMFESGGNPSAINLWDSNAQAGYPSQGLMQTIPQTFNAYHQSGTSYSITDPVANIAAAINYIRSRYGSIFAIDPPVQGYARGAWDVPRNMLAHLDKSEMVIPRGPATAIRAAADGGARSGGPAVFAEHLVEEAVYRGVARAMSGATIRFDSDGLARIVTKQQMLAAARGPRR